MRLSLFVLHKPKMIVSYKDLITIETMIQYSDFMEINPKQLV